MLLSPFLQICGVFKPLRYTLHHFSPLSWWYYYNSLLIYLQEEFWNLIKIFSVFFHLSESFLSFFHFWNEYVAFAFLNYIFLHFFKVFTAIWAVSTNKILIFRFDFIVISHIMTQKSRFAKLEFYHFLIAVLWYFPLWIYNFLFLESVK